jgi:hypothetical protein
MMPPQSSQGSPTLAQAMRGRTEPGALPWELRADAMIQLLDPPSWRSSKPGKANPKP